MPDPFRPSFPGLGLRSGPPTIQLKERMLACSNSRWNVYLDHVVDENGIEVRDYLVVEGRVATKELVTGVCVLPVLEGRIGLLRSYRHGIREDVWEAPRGFVDEDEDVATSALRELREETGLTCAPDDLIPLGFITPEASTLAARGALFATTNCVAVGHPDHTEAGMGELELFTLEEIAEMAWQSTIQDASTLVAYYRYVSLQANLARKTGGR